VVRAQRLRPTPEWNAASPPAILAKLAASNCGPQRRDETLGEYGRRRMHEWERLKRRWREQRAQRLLGPAKPVQVYVMTTHQSATGQIPQPSTMGHVHVLEACGLRRHAVRPLTAVPRRRGSRRRRTTSSAARTTASRGDPSPPDPPGRDGAGWLIAHTRIGGRWAT
jgi:hypothetical protein